MCEVGGGGCGEGGGGEEKGMRSVWWDEMKNAAWGEIGGFETLMMNFEKIGVFFFFSGPFLWGVSIYLCFFVHKVEST